jgi:hypothetical protein
MAAAVELNWQCNLKLPHHHHSSDRAEPLPENRRSSKNLQYRESHLLSGFTIAGDARRVLRNKAISNSSLSSV